MDEGPAAPSREGLKYIIFTEINYNPEPADSTDTCKYEFIEIKNTGASSCDMSGVEFTSGITYAFPNGVSIAAGDFYVIAENAADFKKRYGVSPDGVYTGSLKNSGETIVVTDTRTEKQILSVTYSDTYPWPSKADGSGFTLVPKKPKTTDNPDSAAYWGVSTAKNGSPGADEPVVVYINEVLTHTDPPDFDWVEFYNPEKSPVSIGGWYLTDAKDDPLKYKIPDGTIVQAEGYLVISELQFNDSTKIISGIRPFRLDSHGEEVYLIPPSGACTGGQCQGCKFGELENGVTIGRYITSTGAIDYPRMAAKTPGTVNSDVAVGPVVISEIMYNPPVGLYEYIAITNISAADVPLFYKSNDTTFYKANDSTHNWKIKGTGFTFPAKITIKPAEKIYIVSDTIAVDTFRTLMKLAATVRVFSTSMDLDNGGEDISLMKPEDPYYDAAAADTLRPHMTIDEVDYKDSSPWPKEADGKGYALVRISNSAYGNDPINWKAEKRTP
jgi:hypothetical protein